MRAAEFDQRGIQLDHHAVRRRIDQGRWFYDETTVCGRPVPQGLGLSLLLDQPTPACARCLSLLAAGAH